MLLIALGQVYAQKRFADLPAHLTPGPGRFEGKLVLLPSDDGRTMKVMERFSYSDWEGNKLTAEPGFISDGATIPRAAWSIIGGPWDGKYRNAAVIHDVGCVNHKYTWQITDLMFYQAMRDSNVSNLLALTMYYAVLKGGPRWEVAAENITAENAIELAKKVKAKKTQLDKSIQTSEMNQDLVGPKGEFLGTLTMVENVNPVIDKDLKLQGKTVQATLYFQVQGKVTRQQIEDTRHRIERREAAGQPVSPDEVLGWTRTEPATK